MDEERGGAELREMRGAQLVGGFGRMQRVGKQEERVGERGIGGGEHGGLASSVGMAAEKYAAGDLAADCFDCLANALLVAGGAAALGRSVGAELAERQIAAEDEQAGFAEGVC